MAISAANLKIKYSTKSGAAGNSLAGTANGSLGKYISTTEITSDSLHNLFDLMDGTENANSEAEYRCVFLDNLNSVDTFFSAAVFIAGQNPDGATIEIGLDPTGIKDRGSVTAQALEITTEDDAPVGVTFSAPTTDATALVFGDLGPGKVVPLWLKRTGTNSAELKGDSVTLSFIGETL